MQPSRNVLLVDYENRQLDLSVINADCDVIIFVGVLQDEIRIKKKISAKQNKYSRVDYVKVNQLGKNALDFHIAFELGSIYEKSRQTICYILSGDKGFDPLVFHLNAQGLNCSRIEKLNDLPECILQSSSNDLDDICIRCKISPTIEHNGGRWCPRCGKFSVPPDPFITSKLVENKSSFRQVDHDSKLICSGCNQKISSGDGVCDDGEWTCWGCIAV